MAGMPRPTRWRHNFGKGAGAVYDGRRQVAGSKGGCPEALHRLGLEERRRSRGRGVLRGRPRRRPGHAG
eukprot:8434760-Alexandrium_andersonii.AAC.1